MVENDISQLDFSDSPLGSGGARCVASAISCCKDRHEIHLSNCEIQDSGALALFEELKKTPGVKLINLDGNQMTENCLD